MALQLRVDNGAGDRCRVWGSIHHAQFTPTSPAWLSGSPRHCSVDHGGGTGDVHLHNIDWWGQAPSVTGTHCCIWASSCALRTTGGVESLRKSTKFLRQKQRAFFSMFCAVVLCFFLSSLVHVYSLESAERLSTVPRVILTVVFVCGLALAFRLHKQFRHNRKSAKLVVIEDGVGDIGDLDEHAAQHWQRLVHASFHKAQFNPKWWPL